MEAPLVLIASYPKSGNTWVRTVLQGLLTPGHMGDINRIEIGLYGYKRRRVFDYYAPVSASEMTPDEIELMLPSVFADCARDAQELVFIKVHDLARQTSRGEWIFPPNAVRRVIYLVRHPFDVAASFSNHLGVPIDETVKIMTGQRPNWFLATESLPLNLQETDGNWSANAESWLYRPNPYRVMCLRYEDLYRDPLRSFKRIAAALELPTDERLDQAVDAAKMERLQDREKEDGFRERPSTTSAFFRQGGSLTWKDTLSLRLRDEMAECFGATMKLLGYENDGSTSR